MNDIYLKPTSKSHRSFQETDASTNYFLNNYSFGYVITVCYIKNDDIFPIDLLPQSKNDAEHNIPQISMQPVDVKVQQSKPQNVV